MASNSRQMADASISKKLTDAQHAGWLAGVALRLGSNRGVSNPYERGSEQYLYWDAGFEEGFSG